MSKPYDPRHVDIRAFAQEEGVLDGQGRLGDWARLLAEAGGTGHERPVTWTARGQLRQVAGAADQVWLHLEAETLLPLICQRCLTPVDIEDRVDRDFRFVSDEATALAQDDESEEDLLVLSHGFDLLELIEDELLMALPVVPKHDTCPVPVKLAVADEAFEATEGPSANPFAVLQKLRTDKSS